MTPELIKSLPFWKQDNVSQKWLWRDAGSVLFQYLGYSIHLPLISFSFIIEGSLILYTLLVVFHITLSTITAAVWTVFSLELVCLFSYLFFTFHTQCCLFFLVRLVIFRWNIIARIFSVLWVSHPFLVFNPYDISSVPTASFEFLLPSLTI